MVYHYIYLFFQLILNWISQSQSLDQSPCHELGEGMFPSALKSFNALRKRVETLPPPTTLCGRTPPLEGHQIPHIFFTSPSGLSPTQTYVSSPPSSLPSTPSGANIRRRGSAGSCHPQPRRCSRLRAGHYWGKSRPCHHHRSTRNSSNSPSQSLSGTGIEAADR